MKVETISINMLTRKMYHAKSSGINTTEYPKKEVKLSLNIFN